MKSLTAAALRSPLLTLLMATGLCGLSMFAAMRAPRSAGAHAIVGADHPVVRGLERFTERFGGGFPIIVAWSCGSPGDPCRSVFDAASLRMAHEVGSDLASANHVVRVSSPAHSVLMVARADGLVAHRFFGNDGIDAPTEFVEQALADPLWRGAIVSGSGRTGALVIETDTTDPRHHEALVSAIETAVAPFARRGFRFRMAGYPWLHVAAARGIAADGLLVGASTFSALAICFGLMLRSWQSVLGVLATIGLASGCALAVVAVCGWPWDNTISAAPTLVLVLGSSDAIHFITSYWRERTGGLPREAALLAAAGATAAPCAMTAATSIAGLLSFLGVDAVSFAHFGAVAAAGVAASFVLTFTALPALFACLPDTTARAVRDSRRWDGAIASLVELPIRHRRPLLAVAAITTLIGALGITRLNTNASLRNYWRKSDPIRTGVDFVSTRLSSFDVVEIDLTLPNEITDGDELETVRRLEEQLQRAPGVRQVRTLTTLLERSAKALGARQFDADTAAETLALVSLGDPSTLDQWISFDHRQLRLSVVLEPSGRDRLASVLEEIRARLDSLPPTWSAELTGPAALELAVNSAVADAALQSVSASSLLVTLLVMAFLRSVRWGLLAMLPNVVPMVALFGSIGWRGIPLDGGAAVVAPIAIGIAVDDTIHFLHCYAARRRGGLASLEAARFAARHVGRAMTTTSATLVCGFLAMQVTRFQAAVNIAQLSALAIAAAFAAELLLLPALLATFGRERTSVPANDRRVRGLTETL